MQPPTRQPQPQLCSPHPVSPHLEPCCPPPGPCRPYTAPPSLSAPALQPSPCQTPAMRPAGPAFYSSFEVHHAHLRSWYLSRVFQFSSLGRGPYSALKLREMRSLACPSCAWGFVLCLPPCPPPCVLHPAISALPAALSTAFLPWSCGVCHTPLQVCGPSCTFALHACPCRENICILLLCSPAQ